MAEEDEELLSPLSSYQALDLTDEKGFLCGKTLADLGVDVIKVEPPGGDPARRIGPFYQDDPHPERSLYWWAYNANKRGITLDIRSTDGQALFRKLVKTADFVIESGQPGYLDNLGLGYASLRELNPRLVFTSISPFGQEGACRNYKATDLTLMAMSSFMNLLGEPDRPPVRVTLPQSYLWASAYATIGTLIAHYHRLKTGEGQHVDVSAQAATAWASAHAPYFWDAMQVNPERAGDRMTGRSHKDPEATYPATYPCKDGYIAFPLYSGRAGAVSNKALVEWMDEHGLSPPELKEKDWERFDQFQATQAEYDQITGPISRFLMRFNKRDFYLEAVRRRIMGYPVSTAKDILEDPHLEARHFWERVEHSREGEGLAFPGPFAKLSLTPLTFRRRAPLVGEHNEEVYGKRLGLSSEEPTAPRERESLEKGSRPFEDLKVLEFTHVAAGPIIGRFLADYGAEVIHVESRSRPDIMRSYPPAMDNLPGTNRGLLFAIYNTNKYGITLNLKHPKAVELAKGLVEWSDVVIENFTPGTMARLGLGYDDLRQTKPDLIMLSTCNMGQTGPHADNPGYGSHLTYLSGFGHLTGWPDRPPVLLYGPYVDMISAAFSSCALMAALDHRHRTGRGQYIDVSQYETGLQFMTPALLDYQVNGRLTSREGNRSPCAVPHGAYPCRGDDRWCVIAVWSDEEWDALGLAIGGPQWARDHKFATLQGRKENEEELNAHLAQWTRRFTPEEIMERLQAVGVEAGVVMTCQEIVEDPSVRNYLWDEAEHPEIGKYQVELAGFKPSKTTHQIRMPGPLLGQHNERVLTQILGVSLSEFEQLQSEGVFD